ncbi:MAG: DNRLRE domain-containing protein [Alteromonadaceae bacterium]|nr:DNRLRE domain-containing protein [Alteromonadaceae bacterium]
MIPSSGPEPTPPPSADTVLSAVADTFISEKLPEQNFNAVTDQLLADGNDGTYGSMKILLAWDVSAVESCNVVTAASIEMQIFNTSPGTYEVYSSVSLWVENEVAWSSLSGDGTLMGTFNPSSKGSRTVALSTNGLDIVQNWITSSDNNNGIVITSADTVDGIDVEDREQGMAAKLSLTLDSSACAETPAPETPTSETPDNSEGNKSDGGSMSYFYLLVLLAALIRKVKVNVKSLS